MIAVSVQEDSVVALANVKHRGGLFEKLAPASSPHYAQLAAEGPKSQVDADSPCNAVRSS